MVKVLLDAGAAKDSHGSDHIVPLWVASFNGHAHVVDVLLAAGADLNDPAAPALNAAAQNGHDLVVSLLLAAGADMNALDNIG